MSDQQSSRINPNLPDSYNPVIDERNFAAPSHHLSTGQKEQIAELAEASAGHIQPGGSNLAGGQFGSGSLGSSNNTSSLADTLSPTGGQQRGHVGQYEYTENQLDEPIDKVRGGSGIGSTGHSSGLSGTGHGTHQAAGAGVGGGLAAAAAQQGLGSTGQGHGQPRGIEDQHIGGLVGDSNYNDRSRSGAGLGAGAGAAGLAGAGAGAGAYGASSGRTGQGSNMQEAISDARGGHSGSSGLGSGTSAVGTGAGLTGAGAAGAAGLTSGQRDPSGHGAGAGEKGMLAQPQHETGLTSELERRAQKAGTHAAGFGTHGNE